VFTIKCFTVGAPASIFAPLSAQ